MTRFLSVTTASLVVASFAVLAVGCAPKEEDDAERFREALPVQDEVALRVPSNQGTTSSTSQGLRIATAGSTNASTNATYYELTREFTAGVDGATALILGGVWAIVHLPPTTIEPKRAVWGPGQANALEPAVWRFTVNEVGDKEYDYVLEGQPKAGGTWLPVLRGHGYGKERTEHKQGWFSVDNDNYRALEPTRGKDYGTTKITYDLRQLPATILAELRPGDGRGFVDFKVTHDVGGAGSITITGQGDLDDSKATKMEDIAIVSRWASDGSGRADASLANGDMPQKVEATECWSTAFARVYYKDTVDYEAPTGDVTQCSFAAK